MLEHAGMTASPPSARAWQAGLFLILLLAAYVQFITVTQTEVDTPIRADAADYVTYAHNLKTSGIYSREAPAPGATLTPDNLRTPGYPLFLIPFLDPSIDVDTLVARITGAQGILAVLCVFLTFQLARTVVGPHWALPAAAAQAVAPHGATASTYLLTETLFTTLVLAFALLAARSWTQRHGWLWMTTAGLLLGAACLVRPTLQLLPIIALALIPLMHQAWQRKALIVLCAGFACAYAPWLLRNASLPTQPAAQSLTASQILHGSYPDMMFDGEPQSRGIAYRFDPAADAAQRSLGAATALVLERAAAEPLTYLRWYLLGKPATFLSWGMIAGMGDLFVYPVKTSPYLHRTEFKAMRAIALALHWPMVILALATLALVAVRPRVLDLPARWHAPTIIVVLIVAYAIALHMIVAPYPRYSIPFRPFLAILALLAARSAWTWYRVRREETPQHLS